jgi:hypothetical protein
MYLRFPRAWIVVIGITLLWLRPPCLAATPGNENADFPRAVTDYNGPQGSSLWEVLTERIRAEPFNLAATLIFLFAIVHTFLAPMFLRLSHRFERQHQQRQATVFLVFR